MDIPFVAFADLREGDEFVRIAGRCCLVRMLPGYRSEPAYFAPEALGGRVVLRVEVMGPNQQERYVDEFQWRRFLSDPTTEESC